MPNFIELLSGEVIDIENLQDIFIDEDGRWKSNTTDDCVYTWNDRSVDLIRKAMVASSNGDLRGSFMCSHCGAPNVVREGANE